MFPRQDNHALAVLTDTASGDLQQYLAGVHHQRDTLVVMILFSFLGGGNTMVMASFYLSSTSPPLATNDDTELSPGRARITIGGDLTQLNGDSFQSTAVSFANEHMALVSC